jgi:hypothetical protein
MPTSAAVLLADRDPQAKLGSGLLTSAEKGRVQFKTLADHVLNPEKLAIRAGSTPRLNQIC